MNHNPLQAFSSVFVHRELIQILAKREIQARYRGALMGNIWMFLQPLLMLTIYTFVFKYIFPTRFTSTSDSGISFAQFLFAGMIVHGFAGEVIGLSPTLILNNSAYVKKVTFPLEILSLITVKTALVHACFNILILLVIIALTSTALSYHLIYLPLIIFPLFIFLIGLSWTFTSLGVYFRDLGQFSTFLVSALLFLSPVFYSVESTPAAIASIINLSPLTVIIEQTRAVILNNQTPDFIALGWYYCFAFLVFFGGFMLFSKLRRGFADVL